MFSYAFNNTNDTKTLTYLCFEAPNEGHFAQDYLIFIFIVVDYGKLLDVYDYEDSKVQGGIYRNILPKGKIGIYHFSKSIVLSKKNDYTLRRINSISKLYWGECQIFPNCRYKVDDLSKFNVNKSAKINTEFIYTSEDDRNAALATIKDVMIIHCEESMTDYCEYDKSFSPKVKI